MTSKIGRMCALVLSIARNVVVGRATALPDCDVLYLFSGVEGAMVYTIERSGANLPEAYSPWQFIKTVSTDGPTFKAGADKAALKEVRAKGFSVRVFLIVFE